MNNEKTRPNVWWLAQGHRSRTRQPSFAPDTARAVVTMSSFAFGWNRYEACFVTSKKHDVLAPADIERYPCDQSVALGMLWQCGRRDIHERFFDGRYRNEDDADIFAAAGHMFGVSLLGCEGEASLHFYSPSGLLQRVYLHSGMTTSFRKTIFSKPAVEIYRNLQ